jgi:hypothetical protein
MQPSCFLLMIFIIYLIKYYVEIKSKYIFKKSTYYYF